MSLDKVRGNPAWVKGKSANPKGRPIGAKSVKGILKVAAMLAEKKRHPVHELMRLADEAYRQEGYGGRELAAKIWADLLKYCEPQKKPQEVAPEVARTPEESKAAADEQMRLIQELENGANGQTEGSDSSRLADRPIEVPPEAVPKEDLRSDQGE